MLTKILAARLNKVILDLVHPDQTGFLPGKSPSENIWRAQVVAQIDSKRGEDWTLASLDAAKAFDSIEWGCLIQVLKCFGFGDVFMKWISALYKSPKAALLVNGSLSPSFRLHIGTRQRCPISLVHPCYRTPCDYSSKRFYLYWYNDWVERGQSCSICRWHAAIYV